MNLSDLQKGRKGAREKELESATNVKSAHGEGNARHQPGMHKLCVLHEIRPHVLLRQHSSHRQWVYEQSLRSGKKWHIF